MNGISANKIKEIKKLHQKKFRDETGLFIAEGFKIFEEIISAGIKIKSVFVLPNVNTDKITVDYTVIDESSMKKISTTESVCEILTVAEKKHYDINILSNMKQIALLDEISDPGNLGTIIRSAAAFGIDAIILHGNCVDLYSPKVIRSSAGNFFKIPIIPIKRIRETEHACKEHIIYCTAPGKESTVSLGSVGAVSEKIIIMFGSEAKGLSTELLSLADYNIRLDMAKNVESLNLAVSASIIFYELYKNSR